MELKEFIKEVLTDIIDAVGETQAYAKDTGAIIAPVKDIRHMEDHSDQYDNTNDRDTGPSNIEFTVLLTDKGTNGSGGKIGVSFGSLGVGYTKGVSVSNEQSTQVSFTIPLFYPRQK